MDSLSMVAGPTAGNVVQRATADQHEHVEPHPPRHQLGREAPCHQR